jgi:hypothetical protein
MKTEINAKCAYESFNTEAVSFSQHGVEKKTMSSSKPLAGNREMFASGDFSQLGVRTESWT